MKLFAIVRCNIIKSARTFNTEENMFWMEKYCTFKRSVDLLFSYKENCTKLGPRYFFQEVNNETKIIFCSIESETEVKLTLV